MRAVARPLLPGGHPAGTDTGWVWAGNWTEPDQTGLPRDSRMRKQSRAAQGTCESQAGTLLAWASVSPARAGAWSYGAGVPLALCPGRQSSEGHWGNRGLRKPGTCPRSLQESAAGSGREPVWGTSTDTPLPIRGRSSYTVPGVGLPTGRSHVGGREKRSRPTTLWKTAVEPKVTSAQEQAELRPGPQRTGRRQQLADDLLPSSPEPGLCVQRPFPNCTRGMWPEL